MTNFTNEQLEAWAKMGPWFAEPEADDGPVEEYIWKVYHVDEYVNDGDKLIAECNVLGGDDAALIAAAPTLAAALLSAREEIADLKHKLGRMTDIQKRTHKKVKARDAEITELKGRIIDAHSASWRFRSILKGTYSYFWHVCDILDPHSEIPPSHERINR